MAGRPLAVVTGASAGIGRELADILAREGHDLVLVARREGELKTLADELQQRHHAESIVAAADLSQPDAADQVVAAIGPDRPVDVLVNNAGFGGHGAFADRPRADELRMLAVNVTALTDLTRVLLPGMVARGRGRILNVGSTAAFQPGPFMAVYYATKAYVLSFSQAIAEETRGTGVTVTCLCPGVTTTEFQQVAGVEDVPLTKGPLSMSARDVAEAAYAGMTRGKLIVIPGVHNKIGAQSTRFAPRGLMLKVVRRLHPVDH
ncbi:MAG TPA: SDR family oxidoreductase [Mycobacteriales bacterium]|nr:SDR family oxidoreductase [Mycobacteriales bacterium]